MRGRSDFLWSEATLELVALHAIRGGQWESLIRRHLGESDLLRGKSDWGQRRRPPLYCKRQRQARRKPLSRKFRLYRSPDRYRYSEPDP